MSNQIPMTTTQFLNVRNAVAEQLQTSGSRQQIQTRVAIAENLMAGGYIDLEFVQQQIEQDQEAQRTEETVEE